MEEVTLYRKMRPMRFEQIVGQDLIVKALKNQIINDRFSHAYLFYGIRGTGKTTAARIFARAINCENPQNGNPCNECTTCKKILSGQTNLVIEWDAATKGRIENVRDIQDYIRTRPIDGKYRVFIIDEIQEMFPSAVSAFLKTIEEPPEYVVFIFATTKLKRIFPTIISRCQKYDFQRIPYDLIINQLGGVAESNGIYMEDKAIKRIAILSEGSMRDALSLYDRVEAMVNSNKITLEDTLDALGRVDTQIYAQCVRNILDEKAGNNVLIFNQSIDKGISEEQFLTDFLWYLKNMYLFKTEGSAEEEAFSEDEYGELSNLSNVISAERINYLISLLDKTQQDIQFSKIRRILIEVALIKAGMPSEKERIADLSHKIDIYMDQLNSYEQ